MLDTFSRLPNLKADLDRVEKRLEQEISSEVDFLTQVANHLIPAGGKRIRPGFAITTACLEDSGPVSDEVIIGATSVELVHLGSLYHDDVMDGAEKRRNVESVNARYGDHTAILAGDFLLAKASLLSAQLGAQFSSLLAQTIASLCEGQILEHRAIHNLNRSPEEYMEATKGKTASLLSASCKFGALAVKSKSGDLLGEFGHTYGMAFQIIDDISDLLTDGSEMGKPGGNDIMEGNYTLPVIHALQSGDKELKKVLLDMEKDSNWEQVEKARELVIASDGPAKAEAKAREFIATARGILEKLTKSKATEAFEAGLDSLSQSLKELA